jgi:POT family proton-dependent oligopeptide transporter
VWGRNKYLKGIGLPPSRAGAHHPASQRGADYTAGDVAEGAVVQAEAAAAQQLSTPVPGVVAGLVGAVGGYLAGGVLGLFMGGIILWALATTVLGTRGEERNRVLAIFLVVFFVIFFWAAYEQAGSSMNLFADKNTDLTAPGFLRGFAGGDRMPASWFQSVNPLVLLASAPLFAMLWPALARAGREPSTAMKMVIGLALLGLGFVFMVLGARGAEGGALVSPWWLVGAYAFHTWGELCLLAGGAQLRDQGGAAAVRRRS